MQLSSRLINLIGQAEKDHRELGSQKDKVSEAKENFDGEES